MNKTVIDASKKGLNIGLAELRQYKDLFLTLAYRDYRVRYAQTFLGFLWALLQPVITVSIFYVIFGLLAGIESGIPGVPYILFAMCGMSGWTYFSFVVTNSGNSIILHAGMIKKIYFPRLIIPLSKAVTGLIDFLLTFIILAGIMIYVGHVPPATIALFPIYIILTIVTSLAVGVWLSALTIRYRDFQHLIPFMVQVGLYATPVAYPAEKVVNNLPQWATALYFTNPMAGICEGYRYCLLGGNPPVQYAYISYGIIVLLFVSSLYYFKKAERSMADLL